MLLSSYPNVPSERTANLIGMLPGIPVSPGFVDLAGERLDSRLQDAGFDEAMQAALREEPVLAVDETPVNLLDPRAGLAEEDADAPHPAPRPDLAACARVLAARGDHLDPGVAFFSAFGLAHGPEGHPIEPQDCFGAVTG